MKKENIYKIAGWIELACDLISMTVAYLVASFVWGAYANVDDAVLQNLLFYFTAICVSVIVLYMLDAYGSVESYSTQKRRISSRFFVAQLLSIVANFLISIIFYKKESFVFLFWILFYVVGYGLLVLTRNLVLKQLIKIRKRRSLLILFPEDSPEKFLNKLKRNSEDFGSIEVYKIPADTTEIAPEAQQLIEKTDSLLITSNISEELQNKYILCALKRGDRGNAPTIKIVSTVENLSLLGGRIVHIGDTPVIAIKNKQLGLFQKAVKRSFDFIAALIGLIVLSPIFLICAIAIKIDSPGPVFYKQERYTIQRKKFDIIKFRTMTKDAEKYGARLATEKDDRITKVGRILRACRLDELPQLINIIKGEMSIVGPRPERPIYADEYSKMVKNFDIRYLVKAGLTGYAQVYGQYNTKVSDKVLFDSIYINSFSLWLDLKLIVLTLVTMITKEATEGVDEELATVPSTDKHKKDAETADNSAVNAK